MHTDLLRKHIAQYLKHPKQAMDNDTQTSRTERVAFYSSWTAERMAAMTRDDLYDYLAKLWAMLIWGNKAYVVDKLIADNGLPALRTALAALVWGRDPVAARWDAFRKQIKGIGPAMMSELLVYVHSKDCMLWNRRASVGLNYLGVAQLPRYQYQLTGKKYVELCGVARVIANEMAALGARDPDLLDVDYFIWSELQVVENLSDLTRAAPAVVVLETEKLDKQTAELVHNEVRDKLEEIGLWLGLQASTEVKVADGAVVDTIWEATIGNMGRVIYVFEVQSKGSVDSLVLNLMKALNNPAVQGVVAVSDKTQLARIEKESANLPGMKGKLKCWDYAEVLAVHEALASVNEKINALGLVPQGFNS